mgnify:FL=1
MRVIIRGGAHILLIIFTKSRNYIRKGENFHLNGARVLFQKVVQVSLFEKAGIVTAFDVNGVDLQEATGTVSARFHFDFCYLH